MMIFPKKQLLAALFVYIGQMLVGFGLGWTAPVVPKLQDPDQTPLPNVITDQEASWIGSVIYIGTIGGDVKSSSIPQCLKTKVINQCVLPVMTYGAETWTLTVGLVHQFKVTQRAMERAFLGVFLKYIATYNIWIIEINVGPYVTSFLSNYVGRKPSLLLGGCVCALSFIILALANNLTMIYAGRIFNGFGTGIVFVMNLVYIGEIASTPIRGVLLTITAIFGTLGTLVIYSVGPYVSYSVTSYIGLAITLVYIGGILFIPETPLFLAMKGKQKQAEDTLKYLGREEDIDLIKSSKEEKAEPMKLSDLVKMKSNRKALFITLSLNIFQQLSGAIVVIFFATNIFDLADSSIESNIATIIIGITQLGSSCITPFVVERFGRKILMLLSTAVCFLSLGSLGTYFYFDQLEAELEANVKWLPLVTLIIFFLFYDIGFGIIPNTLTGEMFSPSVRSVGATITITISWLVGFAIATAFAAMLELGPHFVFWFYTAACAAAFIFTLVFVPETKGKSLDEIQEMLSR